VSAWELTNTVALLALPPGCLIVLGAVACIAAAWRPRTGIIMAGTAFMLLFVLSTKYVGDSLLGVIEPSHRDPAADPSGGAIVVLGGGTYYSAPEYGGDTVATYALARLRYGARLHRILGKPVLVTGGAPSGESSPEAASMKKTLIGDFNVPVAWTEERSRNTLENARFSWAILKAAKVTSIYLVTDAWHMPRAVLAFERAGFRVIPAPTGYATSSRRTILDFLPSPTGFRDSHRFFHEVVGLAWYRLRMAAGQ
jgi:uncharacterized SAM-binding protein YcdF (DUF218 family)